MRSPFPTANVKPPVSVPVGATCPLPAAVWHMVLDGAFLVDLLPKTLYCLGIHGRASDSDCWVSLFLLDTKLAFY